MNDMRCVQLLVDVLPRADAPSRIRELGRTCLGPAKATWECLREDVAHPGWRHTFSSEAVPGG